MKQVVYVLLCFLLMPVLMSGQEVEVKRERIFTGPGLYGFMNGGAEQFLEYGVTRLTTRDVVYKGEAYTIDIYEMPGAEEAFGIYSLHVFRCGRADTLGCVDCLSPYQLQAVDGSNYISVVFPSGSAVAKGNADELLRRYLPMDGKENPKIPELFAGRLPYSGRLKYLKGPISVSGVSTSLSHYLKDIPYTGVWFLADKPSKGYRALICAGKEEIEKLKTKVPASDILQSNDTSLYISGMEKENPRDDHGGFGF